MAVNSDNISKKLSPTKIILPVFIGFLVVGYLFYDEFDANVFATIVFSPLTIVFLIIAFLMMLCRDLGYIIRLRILTDNKLSWKNAIKIILLWEFSSAVTPSAIGGTGIAIFFLYKEGFTFGRSSAMIMATAFLDEFYFLIMFPILTLIVGASDLFTIGGEAFSLTNKYFIFAFTGYLLKVIFDLFVGYGLFINPRGLKWLLLRIFKFSLIRKWRYKMHLAGNDIIYASKEFKSKSFTFWLKMFGATVFSWSGRYWVLNFLILALVFGIPEKADAYLFTFGEHFEIFARQLVMWVMMIVMPTPGGSGASEYIFSDFMQEFIPVGLVGVMAFTWRMVTYYPYLFIGAFVLPVWVKKKFSSKA